MENLWMIPMSMTNVYLKECMELKRREAHARTMNQDDYAVVTRDRKRRTNAKRQKTNAKTCE
jgi:hypothetical protein